MQQQKWFERDKKRGREEEGEKREREGEARRGGIGGQNEWAKFLLQNFSCPLFSFGN